MGFWDWLTGRDATPPPAVVPEVDPAPTEADILAALDGVDQLIGSGTLPAVVRSRAARVTRLVRQTLPRLGSLGLGSYDSYSVVATATDYLPEAIGAYLRLPRDWADSRPVENGKTPLLPLAELEAMGFKIAVYALSLLNVAITAQLKALAAIKEGRPIDGLTEFRELQRILGFDTYDAEVARYDERL